MYKMVEIRKEEYEKCKVEIIAKEDIFWVNRKYLEVESDVANWAQIFYKCDQEKQKYRQELTPNVKYEPCRVFVPNDLVEKKFKSCRKSPKRFLEFKQKSGLDPYVVTCDEQDIINTLQVVFEGDVIFTQYCIENKRLDICFSNHKLGIEVDGYNHEGRNTNYEKSRQLMIESHGITIIRTNPDAADFDMNKLINQIYTHIIKSTKKSLIDDLSKRLLELEFKSNPSVRSKCLKWVVKT